MITLALLQQAAPAEAASSGVAWIDQVGLGLVALFFVLGIWRGLWWQVIRLLGVVAAVVLARSLTPRFSTSVEEATEFSADLSHGIVWFGLFVAGLVIASLLGMIGKKALEAMQLGLVDRAGGAFAGALTGLLLHSVVLVVICGLGTDSWSKDAITGTRSAILLDTLSRKAPLLLDSYAAERLPLPALSPEPE